MRDALENCECGIDASADACQGCIRDDWPKRFADGPASTIGYWTNYAATAADLAATVIIVLRDRVIGVYVHPEADLDAIATAWRLDAHGARYMCLAAAPGSFGELLQPLSNEEAAHLTERGREFESPRSDQQILAFFDLMRTPVGGNVGELLRCLAPGSYLNAYRRRWTWPGVRTHRESGHGSFGSTASLRAHSQKLLIGCRYLRHLELSSHAFG